MVQCRSDPECPAPPQRRITDAPRAGVHRSFAQLTIRSKPFRFSYPILTAYSIDCVFYVVTARRRRKAESAQRGLWALVPPAKSPCGLLARCAVRLRRGGTTHLLWGFTPNPWSATRPLVPRNASFNHGRTDGERNYSSVTSYCSTLVDSGRLVMMLA